MTRHNTCFRLTIALFAIVTLIVGCQPATTAPALTRSQLENIKAPMNLAELERKFGPHHSATSKQTEALMATINHMPEEIRKNAMSDKTVAWGNDDGFLVGKANDAGTVWVISYHHQH